MRHPHPSDFYIVHALMTCHRNGQTVTEWGSLSDGPYDRTQAMHCVSDHFRRETPTLQNLCVIHVQDDVRARDVTEDMIGEIEAEVA